MTDSMEFPWLTLVVAADNMTASTPKQQNLKERNVNVFQTSIASEIKSS
jgi:hypothetical protein